MFKLTGDTITDEQIRELRDERAVTRALAGYALTDPKIRHVQRYAARARCAEIFNARLSAPGGK